MGFEFNTLSFREVGRDGTSLIKKSNQKWLSDSQNDNQSIDKESNFIYRKTSKNLIKNIATFKQASQNATCYSNTSWVSKT